MLLEVVGALAIGALVLWLVFEPVVGSGRSALVLPEPEAPEETRRGVALLALKEIEFDRETGKLSDSDYEYLKTRYSTEALAAIDADATGADPEEMIAARVRQLRSAGSSGPPPPPPCAHCGPRPESDALFCSACGLSLSPVAFCSACGAPLEPESRFCAGCGAPISA
jgi:hypothetical protein